MRSQTLRLLLVMVLALLLAACSGDDDDATPEPEVTAVVTAETTPEVEVTQSADDNEQPVQGPEPDVNQLDGTFEGLINAQLYTFEASEGTAISITMAADEAPDLDSFLALLTLEGVLLASDDDGAGQGVDAALTDVTVPADGTYLLLVTSRRGISEPRYLLDNGDLPAPLNYTLNYSGVQNFDLALLNEISLTSLDLALGTETAITLDADRPVVFMPVAAEANDALNVITGGEPFAADTVIYVFDEEGRRIAVQNDTEEGFFAVLEDFAIPADGNYLILVTTRDFIDAGSDFYQGGTFSLTVDVG